jgi:hypothetical protein
VFTGHSKIGKNLLKLVSLTQVCVESDAFRKWKPVNLTFLSFRTGFVLLTLKLDVEKGAWLCFERCDCGGKGGNMLRQYLQSILDLCWRVKVFSVDTK